MHRGVLVFFFLFSFFGFAWSQTTLPATIVGDVTLLKAESPYESDQNLSISAGASLTIEAGVQIIMTSGSFISNAGRLVVNGTKEEEVLITSKSEFEKWKYIINDGTLDAKFLHINNAVRFVSSYGDTLLINNCTVTNTSGTIGDDCIGAHNAKKVIVRNSTLEGNPEAGKTDAIDLDNISNDTLSGNTIYNFSDDGIDIGTGSSNIVITDNHIYNCDMGISIGESTTSEVKNNLVHHCVSGLQSHYSSVMNAQNNTLFANLVGLRAYHNSSEETSGGTIICSNTIISHCRALLVSTKENSLVQINYCLTDDELLDGTGNIIGEANFVDTISYNFNLLSASPAIDAGDPDSDGDGSDYLADIDDRDEDGSRKDIGAFPFYNSSLRIIEVSSSNLSMKQDEFGDYPDWITLYNDRDVPINLKAYYLSDNPSNPAKYQISEDLIIDAKDSLLFWADASEIPSGNRLPFKLSGEGEYISLSNPAGIVLDQKLFGRVPVDYFYRRLGLTDEWVYVYKDEPELEYKDVCGGVQFMPEGGAVTFPILASLKSVDMEEMIAYTIDGSNPSIGLSANEDVPISDTMTLRAISMAEDKVPSYTHSEVFFSEAKFQLPVMSLSTNRENLYGEAGIYRLYNNEGPLWERPASFNYYNDDEHFGAITGIRIQGGNSVYMPKKSFRLHFRGGYGSSRLNGSPFESGPNSFKNIVLRAGYDDDITTAKGTMLRDPFSSELWKRLGELATESTFNVLLLNNSYWGIYNVRESVNNYFVEDHIGRDDFDLIRFQKEGPDLKYGTIDEWDKLVNYFEVTDFSRADVYNEVAEFMDMNSLLNLLALVHCSQFRSWTWGAFMVKPNGGKWGWTIWDTDRSYEFLEWNGFTQYASTGAERWSNFIPQKLIQNVQFKNDLINRNCDLLNSVFIPENAISLYDSLVAVIAPEMEAEFDKWNPGNYSNWEINNERIRSFLRNRPAYVYDQMKAYFSLNDTVEITLRIEGNGSVQLNSLLISESEWTGTYMEGNEISLEAIPGKGSAFVEWEALSTSSKIERDPAEVRVFVAKFRDVVDLSRDALVINEIMYHPVEDSQSEWVELYNPNDFALSLDGFVLKDESMDNRFLLNNISIAENGYLVLAGNLNDFVVEFPGLSNVIGSFNSGGSGFNLSNSGEKIYLYNQEGNVEDSVQYSDGSPWPNLADGFGPSLQLSDPSADNMLGLNWSSNIAFYVSPGRSNNVNEVNESILDIELDIVLYPNPVNERLNVQINTDIPMHVDCQIYSISGILLDEFQGEVMPSMNLISWNHSLKNKGAYLLKVVAQKDSQRKVQTKLFIY